MEDYDERRRNEILLYNMMMIEACEMLVSKGICNALKLGIMRKMFITVKKLAQTVIISMF